MEMHNERNVIWSWPNIERIDVEIGFGVNLYNKKQYYTIRVNNDTESIEAKLPLWMGEYLYVCLNYNFF